MQRLSWRTWLSIITALIIVAVLFASRSELARAWDLMSEVNVWLLVGLLVPLQFLSYYATGETLFSYLRTQGHIKHISRAGLARLSLEMNFVNHVLPSAGVSGISYMGWRLRHYGVSLSKSTSGQLVRIVATFGGYAIVLTVAVLFLLIDGELNRWISIVTAVLVAAIFAMIAGMIYLLQHQKRLTQFARWIVRVVNKCVRLVTFGRVEKRISSSEPIEQFFKDLKHDYFEVRANKHLLRKPLAWGVFFTVIEVAMFYAAFVALGHPINPAPIVVAFGLAGAASIFMVTPGGAGVYELVMVGFLAVAGINPKIGIAAIILTRVLLLLGTIIAGYYFYQQAIIKYGKRPKNS